MQLVGGAMGATIGFQTNEEQITEDNDGRFANGYFDGHVDLTHVLSRTLGKQLSQTATYRVNYLSIGVRNIDDTVDNSQAIMLGGNVRYYTPTRQRVDAIQETRTWMREKGKTEEGTSDPYAQFSADKNYRGLRFGWNQDSSIQIEEATTDDSGSMMGGTNLNLFEMFERYNDATGGRPTNEGYDTAGEGQALWESRASTVANLLHFECSLTNRIESEGFASLIPPEDDFFMHDPKADAWVWTAPAGHHLDVLGGLLRIQLTHGNVDAPGTVEDEYEMVVTVGVTGWDEF